MRALGVALVAAALGVPGASAGADEVRFTRALRVRDRAFATSRWARETFSHVYLTSDDGRTVARAWCGWTVDLRFSLMLEVSRRAYFDADDVAPKMVLKAADVTQCPHELRRLDGISAERPLVIRDGRLASEL